MQTRTTTKAAALLAVLALLGALFAAVVPVTAAHAMTGGGTFAWGDNIYGQLGDGTTTEHLTAATTIAPALVDIEGGRHHVLGLEADGGLVAWGWNKYGQVGDGTTKDEPTPASIPGLTATAIATGHYHSLALDDTGQVWGWGRNSNWQMGDGTTTDRSAPGTIPGADGAVDVEAGRNHSMALLADGTVLTWGRNLEGQLGVGDLTERQTPVAIPGLSGVDELVAGRIHSLALLDDGTVMAWGDNKFGQLGDGTTIDRSSPTAVPGLTGIVELAAFGFHSLALDDTGRVWAWGLGSNGQIGNGNTTQKNRNPVQLASPTNVVTIGAGRNHSIAADSSGGIWGWGKNDLGQLGDGTTTDRPTPVMTGTIADTARLVSGRDYVVALSTSIDPPGMDTTAPNGVIIEPGNNTSVNSPVTLSGIATDNVGVADVEVAVKRLSDGKWLRSDGSFGSFQRQDATVDSPGATTTNWSLSVALDDEIYRMQLTVKDTSGNQDPTKDKHKFTVISGVPDTEPPNGIIDTPDGGSAVPSPVMFDGSATDDIGVAEVEIAVKRLSDGQWYRIDGSFGSYQRHEATLSNPDGPVTDWDLVLALPAAEYRAYVVVFDTSDKKDPSTATRVFTVS